MMSRRIKRRPSRFIWPLIGLLVILAGVTAYRAIQDPLRRDLVSLSKAVYSGDAQGLMAAMLPEEINGCGVTERNLGQLWREHVKPRFDLFTYVSADEISGSDRGLISSRKVQYRHGLTQEIGVGIYPTGDGGKTRVLASLIMDAYRAEAQSQTTRKLDLLELYVIWAGYIERDRAYFESIGLKGVFGPNQGVLTWEQWAAELRAANIRFTAEEAAKKSESSGAKP